MNPGTLPPSLTLEKLRQAHGSVPASPLLAAALVVLAYARTLPGMSTSPGIVPDMRYLSPAYLPMPVMGSMP